MILLALIARASQVLTQTHNPQYERFLLAAETILTRIPPNSSKLSYAFQEWLFHYVSQDGIVYLAVTDTETGRRMPFAFLSKLQEKFLDSYDISNETDDYDAFTPKLASMVKHFNENPDSDPVKQAKAELAGVKDIMTQNVEQILSRGERIELLMDRTDMAANQSLAFRRRAVGLRRQMWWKNVKVLLLAAFSAMVLLFILFEMFR